MNTNQKKVGLVGGISWTSTLEYYKKINILINNSLGGLEYSNCMIDSINYGEIQRLGWENSMIPIMDSCKRLEKCNVDAIALCANTAHMFSKEITNSLNVPLLNIVEATAEKIKSLRVNSVGLLGTKFTMEMDFYKAGLNYHNIDTIVPQDRRELNQIQGIIKNELGKGIVKSTSKDTLIKYANGLLDKGAEGLVLGCTELPLIVNESDFYGIPVFDTTDIHIRQIVNYILENKRIV